MNKIINNLVLKAKEIIQVLAHNVGLQDPENIGIFEIEYRGITELLSKVGAIKTARGTSKVYISETIKSKDIILEKLNIVEKTLINIYDKLESSVGKQLSRKEVSEILFQNGENIDDYYTFIGILSGLNLATSIGGRTGGIKIYNREAELKPIHTAEKEIKGKSEKSKSEREDVLYPSAVKFFSDLGYQALILGTKKRFRGTWNTPDVLGYKVTPYKWLGGAELEILTVEVKWEISKYAIAETNSHQNRSHKSYLLIYQFFHEVEETYLSELISKGIGLICKKGDDDYAIFLPARRNTPDNIDLDKFLDIAMDPKELLELKEEIAKHFYMSYTAPLMPNMNKR